MATLWLQIDADIGDSVTVWQLAELLGVSVESAVGLLVILWGKVLEKRPGGDLSDVPDPLIESWAKWRGMPGVFARAFRDLFVTDGKINGWADRYGKLVAERERERERWHRRNSGGASGGVPAETPPPKSKSQSNTENYEQLQQPPVVADAPTRTPEPVGLTVVEGNTMLSALECAPDLPTMVPPDPPPRPPGMGLVRGGSAAVQRFSAGSYADVTGHLGVVLAEVTTGAARRFRADEKREVMALMLGAYWAAKLHKHPERVKFTKRRVSQLVRVLRENEDDLSELFYVVDGAVRDDYCQGRTQKQHGEKVIELDFLFSSRDRIERLAGHCAGYKAGETHPRVRQIVGDSEGEVVNG